MTYFAMKSFFFFYSKSAAYFRLLLKISQPRELHTSIICVCKRINVRKKLAYERTFFFRSEIIVKLWDIEQKCMEGFVISGKKTVLLSFFFFSFTLWEDAKLCDSMHCWTRKVKHFHLHALKKKKNNAWKMMTVFYTE